jgi:hypothetical protein
LSTLSLILGCSGFLLGTLVHYWLPMLLTGDIPLWWQAAADVPLLSVPLAVAGVGLGQIALVRADRAGGSKPCACWATRIGVVALLSTLGGFLLSVAVSTAMFRPD